MTKSFSKELMRGSIDFMILGVLAEKAKYGYLIQQELQKTSGNRVKVSPGTLYPLLHRMESEKLIRSRWESTTGRRRKWYELTARGRKQLEKQVSQWREYVECVSKVISLTPDLMPPGKSVPESIPKPA